MYQLLFPILLIFGLSTPIAEVSEPIFEPLIKKDPCADAYKGETVKYSCPVCGRCYPIGGKGAWTTVMYCECGCCNTSTYHFECQTTNEVFKVSINECDKIEWGLHYVLVDGDTLFYRGSCASPSDSEYVKIGRAHV